MRHVRAVVMLAMCLALAGCGVAPQPEPVSIDVPVPTLMSPTAPETQGSRAITVYFVRGERLLPTPRAAADDSLETTLALLNAGPAPDEGEAGVRTAIAPESVRAVEGDLDTVVVDVSREFVDTPGSDQLLAVAQIVWTVTETPGAQRVRLTSDGDPVEIPTDKGLSSGAVTRDDYLTIAPDESLVPGAAPTD